MFSQVFAFMRVFAGHLIKLVLTRRSASPQNTGLFVPKFQQVVEDYISFQSISFV